MKPEQLKYSILKKAFSGQLVTCKPDSEKPKVKAIEYDETPFDIPDDWFWSNLGNCCDMYTGNSISESVKKAKYVGLKEGYDYIATKDVTFEHTIEYDNGVRIPVNDDFKIAYGGSVLMCIEGGSAGRKIGILDRNVCFGNKLCSFNSAEIVNTYIYYYLQSHEFKAFFMDNMSGIIGGVSIKKLKDLPIPVPTVSEQKAIVAKIEELLPYVDRYAEAYEKLEQFNAKFPEDMKKSILQYAIQGKLVEQRPEEGTAEELYQQIQDEKQRLIKEGKIKKEKPLAEIAEDEIPFEIPESWKWVRLSDVIDVRDGTHDTPGYIPEGYPLITGKDFYNGYFDFSKTKYISKEDYEEIIKRSKVDVDDILFSMIGGNIGSMIVITEDNYLDMAIKNVALFKQYNYEVSLSGYLEVFLRSQIPNMQAMAKGGAQSFVSLNMLRNYLFPLPPMEEQKRIVSRIKEILPICERLVQ